MIVRRQSTTTYMGLGWNAVVVDGQKTAPTVTLTYPFNDPSNAVTIRRCEVMDLVALIHSAQEAIAWLQDSSNRP